MKSKLPEGWDRAQIKKIADTNKKNYKKSDKWTYVNYLNTGNITNGEIEEIEYINLKSQKLPSRARRKVADNDIVYSTVRPIQKHIGIIKNPIKNMLVSTGFVVITSNQKKVNPCFLYYYLNLNSVTNKLQSIAEQRVSTYPALNVSDIENLQLPKPPLNEQKAIADTLSALDDKIEVNNKINENLEAQAQAIFKHWFVDFEFPDENGMPYKSSGGEMVDSGLGMIPRGWEVKKLKNIVNIKYGKNLPVKNLLSTGYNVFGGNGIIGYYDEYIYEEPEVLIACRGAASGKINISTPKSFVTNNSLVLESSTREVFEYIKGRFTHEDLEAYVTGSAQPQITITNVADVEIIMPDPKTLKKYYDISNSFSNLILKNQIQNQKLSALRDTLLPKLMSGELRIPLDDLNK